MTEEKQSFVGKILDLIFPQKYGFCLHAVTRNVCVHYHTSDKKCHLWDDEFGENPSKCTGRRP